VGGDREIGARREANGIRTLDDRVVVAVSGSATRFPAGSVSAGAADGARPGAVGARGVVSSGTPSSEAVALVGAPPANRRGVGRVDVLARAGVPEIQRARILAALVEVSRERGAGRVTVAHVVARSGVSRRTFYELFEDRDACFLAAFEDAVRRAVARVAPAFDGAESWRERLRAGLGALLEFLEDEPGLGGLCVVDALGAGPLTLERRTQVVRTLVDVVDRGRREAVLEPRPSRLTAEGVVGGVLSVLYGRLTARRPLTERPKPLVRLLGPLMAMIVLPYFGPAAAESELGLPVPRARRRPQRPRSNPLEGLDMRLTYRTVRVLGAIAARADASNREVADAAGIHDQGQISKLLTRLEHLGLIANVGAGQARGEPNAWRLTTKGREVQETIDQQATPATS
jgi:AcrR family transcriptional regulator/DNA-binding MarR family transcriptional regulator